MISSPSVTSEAHRHVERSSAQLSLYAPGQQQHLAGFPQRRPQPSWPVPGVPLGHSFRPISQSEGNKNRVFPDFFIGAHAAVGGFPLLTRDVSRNRTYFPMLTLIAPNLLTRGSLSGAGRIIRRLRKCK